MARRKIASRKRQQNRFSMVLVTVVVLMIVILVSISGSKLKEKLAVSHATEENLIAQIEKQEKRQEEIKEFEKETQTKKYAAEVARDKLGLVGSDEIILEADQ